MSFAKWVYDFTTHSQSQRKKALERFLNEYKEKNAYGFKAFETAQKGRQLKIIGFIPEFHYVPSDKETEHSVYRAKFTRPAVVLKVVNAPVLNIMFLDQEIGVVDVEHLFKESDRTDVKQCLKWVSTLQKADHSKKDRLESKILDNFRNESTNSDSSYSPLAIKAFHKEFKSRGVYDFCGFAANVSYLRAGGEDINALFVHPFAAPVLVYKVKGFSLYSLASPAIRLDHSVLIEGNRDIKQELVGITG